MNSAASRASPTTSSSYNNKNSLVHEIHDNFDFEQKLFQNEGSSTTSNTYQRTNPLIISSVNFQKLSADRQSASLNFSPSTAAVASYFNQNFDENGYVFDGVKIEIEDIDNTSISNITTQSLKRCKSQVLKHYYNLLCFIGWRPFYKEHFYKMPFACRLFNILYPIIIILLLFFAYTYDIITCQGKLNVVYDTEYIPPMTLSPANTRSKTNTTLIVTTLASNISTFFDIQLFGRPSTSTPQPIMSLPEDMQSRKRQQCGHIFTTYIVPSVMHLASYIIGFIYFRINENEQLYALMEKVFLAVNQTLKVVSQDRVIRRLKLFIILGVFWVVLAMSMHILSRLAFGVEQENLKPIAVFVTLQAIALVIENSIYLAVVINHATQSEMIIFYVNEVKTRLEEKSITLKDAIQQILDIRMAIGSLNSTVSKMTSLVALTFVEKFIIGIIILIMNKVSHPVIWVYRSLFAFSWFIILAFTVTQVARLNSICSKFKQIALSARVYGYHNSSRDELDSFLLFIANAKLRAKMFAVPLKPSVILGTLIIVTFTIIILFQTSVITPPDSFI